MKYEIIFLFHIFFVYLYNQKNKLFMETLIKTQEHLDRLIKNTSMIGNIYYDNELNYISIDWKKEYVKMIINDRGNTELERISYEK